QLWEMTGLQRQALVDSADLVLGIGLFGASVAELEPILAQSRTSLLIVNSDHRLIQQSRMNGQAIFRDAEQLRHIAGIQPSTDFDQVLDALTARYPEQADWINARRYWQA